MRQKKVTQQEIMEIFNQILYTYQMFDTDISDLMQVSGFSESKATKIVRKRYKDFIIN